MTRFRELSDVEVERLFDGKVPAGRDDLAEIAGAMTAARRALLDVPGEFTERAHLAAIIEAAEASATGGHPASRSGPTPDRSIWRRVGAATTSFALKLTAATGATVLSLAGLAYAGVDLPGTAAEKAVEKVLQVELPNQDEATVAPVETPKSRADEVEAAKDGFGDERGCEFGQAVSTAASGDASTDDKDPCTKDDKDRTGNAKGKADDKVRGKSEGAPRADEVKRDGSDRRSKKDKSDRTRGKLDLTGKSDEPHGKAGEPHGSETAPGAPEEGEERGKSGEARPSAS